MTTTDNIFKEALTLSPSEKAQLIDKLISTLDESDKKIDELWAKEAEDRINAYDQGKIKAMSNSAFSIRNYLPNTKTRNPGCGNR